MPPMNLKGESAKRALRTFQTDAAALAAGKTPDFTEIGGGGESLEDAVSEIPEVREVSAATPVPVETLPPPAPPLPPPPPPPPEAPPEPIPPSLESFLPPLTKSGASPIRTYTNDFSEHLKDAQASTATVLAAELDSAPPTPRPTRNPRNTLLIAGGVVLLALGAGGAFAAYFYRAAPAPAPVSSGAQIAPIFVDERETVSGAGDALLKAFRASLLKSLPEGNVRLLTSASATTSGSDLFSALQLGAPDVLLRNIDASESIAGILSAKGSEAPFFILSVRSYSDTFAGMLSWEPRMEENLAALFPVPDVAASSTASSTPPAFVDEVVANHDTRALKDKSGTTFLIYGYWNATTLLIARDEAAFAELTDRLANSKTQS